MACILTELEKARWSIVCPGPGLCLIVCPEDSLDGPHSWTWTWTMSYCLSCQMLFICLVISYDELILEQVRFWLPLHQGNGYPPSQA